VRENIASGIESINTEVVSTTNKQNILGAQFNSLVINAGSSNAEIVAGHTSTVTGQTYDTMGHRIDNNDTQLADNVQQLTANTLALGLKASKEELQAIASGTPKGAYTSLALLQTAHPTDDGNIYLVGTPTGYIFDWIGTAWTNTNIQYQGTVPIDGSIMPSSLNSKTQDLINASAILQDSNKTFNESFINKGAIPLSSSTATSVNDVANIDTPYSIEDIPNIQRIVLKASALVYIQKSIANIVNKSSVAGVWLRISDLKANGGTVGLPLTFLDSSGALTQTGDGTMMFNVATELVVGNFKSLVVGTVTLISKVLAIVGDWVYIISSWDSVYANTTKINIFIKFVGSFTAVQKVDYCNWVFIQGTQYIDFNILYDGIKTPKTKQGLTKMIQAQVTVLQRFIDLYGKKYNALGDSLTYGNALGPTITYPALLASRDGMISTNYGINGTTIASLNNGMVNRYSSMSDDADYITVWGGSNDFFANVPIGVSDSVDISTFKGALNVLCQGLLNKYPTKKIGFITPYNLGNGVINYVNAIIEICGLYSIPVLDLYHNMGFKISSPATTQMTNFIDVGVHFNANGYLFFIKKIENFLDSL